MAKSPSKDAFPWPELAQGSLEPVYGIFGEEDFLVQDALEAFKSSPAFALNPSLNIERFSATESSAARIISAAQTLPFLGSKRLIIVTDMDAFKADQLNSFLPYLDNPADTACLVFSARKLDSRTKFAKALTQGHKTVTFSKLFGRQLSIWLEQRALKRNKTLAANAAAILTELSLAGLYALDSEVEKLSLYVGDKPQIEKTDVEMLLGQGRLYSIFDFTDALALSSLTRALSAFNQLYGLGEAPVRVLAMVQRLFRQIAEAKESYDKGGESLARQSLRLPPSATASIISRARQESADNLNKCFKRILETDLALKSSPAHDRVLMERLIMDLCGCQN